MRGICQPPCAHLRVIAYKPMEKATIRTPLYPGLRLICMEPQTAMRMIPCKNPIHTYSIRVKKSFEDGMGVWGKGRSFSSEKFLPFPQNP